MTESWSPTHCLYLSDFHGVSRTESLVNFNGWRCCLSHRSVLDSGCVTETYIFVVLAAYEAVAFTSSLLALNDARFDNWGRASPLKPKGNFPGMGGLQNAKLPEHCQMGYILNHPWELGLVLGLVLGLMLELGRRLATRYRIPEVVERKEQLGTIRDGLFILVSLLLGFTLTLAASRFAERRSLLVEEAVSIGTTYLRASTLPQPYRDHSRQLLRKYVDSRLQLVNADLFDDAVSRAKVLHEDLWNEAAAVAQQDRTAVTSLYLNSLNETIDLHEKRVAAFENRVPQAVWVLVISVSVIAVFTRGATLPSRFWLTLILLPITISIVVALIADLDSPGTGLIQLDQRALHRLKADLSTDGEK